MKKQIQVCLLACWLVGNELGNCYGQDPEALAALVASPEVESREEAAELIAIHFTGTEQLSALWKLYGDPNGDVREEALLTLATTCRDSRFPHDAAVKFAADLHKSLKKHGLENLAQKSIPEKELRAVCYQAKALTALYRHHALLSVHSYRGSWQYEFLAGVAISSCLRMQLDASFDEVFIQLFSEVDDPDAALKVLPVVVESFSRIGGLRSAELLMALRRHPSLGETRALNLQLAVVVEPLIDSILVQIEMQSGSVEAKQIAKGNLLSLKRQMDALLARLSKGGK